MKKPYCSSRHGMPNGAAPEYPKKCNYCGVMNTNFDWYCTRCYCCLDCQRIIKSKFNDSLIAAIKPLPKFEHTRNVVRTYCFQPSNICIRNNKFETIVSGSELVNEVMNGNLDLLGDIK